MEFSCRISESRCHPAFRDTRVWAEDLEMLGKLGLTTHEELLHYVPARYEDRRHLKPVSEAREGEATTVRGKIHSAKAVRWGSLKLEITVAPTVVNNRDDILVVSWFGFRPYGVKEGSDIFLHGRLVRDKKGRWVMSNPEYEIAYEDAESYVHMDRITPIYALTEGVTQRALRRMMYEATQKTPIHALEFYPAPGEMMSREEAFRVIHFPESYPAEERARQRLAYDEFFVLQCVVALRKMSRVTVHRARAKTLAHDLSARWRASLPLRADAGPAAGDGGDRRGPEPWAADESAAAGRRGRGQDVRGGVRDAAGGRGGRAGGADGADANFGRAARAEFAAATRPLGIRVELFTGNTKGKKVDRLQGGELDLFAVKKEARGSAVDGQADGVDCHRDARAAV